MIIPVKSPDSESIFNTNEAEIKLLLIPVVASAPHLFQLQETITMQQLHMFYTATGY